MNRKLKTVMKGILMKLNLSVFLVVFALMFIGCAFEVEESDDWDYSNNPPPVPTKEYPPPVPPEEYLSEGINSNFEARIDAANAITSIITRDQTFSSIAIEASRQLDIANTLRAVSRITSISTRDSIAERCVTPFLNANRIEDARRIANQITSISTKDRVLTRIAQGSRTRSEEL